MFIWQIVDELLQITTKFISLWYVWLNGPTICQHRKEFTFILIKSKARPKLPNTKCRSLHLTFNVCSAKNCISKIVAKKMLTKMSTKTIGRNYHIFNNMHFFDFLHRLRKFLSGLDVISSNMVYTISRKNVLEDDVIYEWRWYLIQKASKDTWRHNWMSATQHHSTIHLLHAEIWN